MVSTSIQLLHGWDVIPIQEGIGTCSTLDGLHGSSVTICAG